MTNEIDEALDALSIIEGIRNESRGVDGFHLNGDIATWSELDIDCKFETIRKALTAAKINQKPLTATEILKRNQDCFENHPATKALEKNMMEMLIELLQQAEILKKPILTGTQEQIDSWKEIYGDCVEYQLQTDLPT